MPPLEPTSLRADGDGPRTGQHVFAWFAYIVFVVYGSLVPMDFQPLPVDQAWAAFRQLPMLRLGVEQRADWVANGVLYVPVGFLTVALFAGRKNFLNRLPLLLGAAVFCFTLALAVEFAQLYFPPRTVSLNDLIAECAGSVVGIVLASYWSDWFREIVATLAGKLGQLTTRLLHAYAIGYLAFSFFPFDFLLSTSELAAKANSDAWGWFLAAQDTNRSPLVVTAKLLAEMLAVLPLGILLGRGNSARQRPATRHAVLYGVLLGTLIEAGQLMIFSGVSQGASLLTRAAGMYGGARVWGDRQRLRQLHVRATGNKGLTAALAALYLLALVAVNGWFDHAWQGVDFATRTLAETSLLPFYYHYYTTEQAALLSLASVTLMYAPIGVLAWLRHWPPALALCTAALAAAAIESSKLFLAGLHPDPSNLLIGAFAAWSLSKLLQRLQEASLPPAEGSPQLATALSEPAAATDTRPRTVTTWPALAATLALTGWLVIDFPFRPLLLGALLLSYVALLWFHPRLLWAAIPAAIALLDLAPWSGRFFFDEFDFLVIISLIVGFARSQRAPPASAPDLLGLAVASLLAVSFVVGTLRGVLPLTLPDADSFSNYYSPYNALRIAKGALWALLLVVLMYRLADHAQEIRVRFAQGITIGLAGTIAVVVWERLAFPGLFEFTDVYRVTGPFSQMHTGGAEIETYLTAAVPFAVALTVQARSLAGRIGGGLLLLGAGYAIAVTFSRAGYAGFAVALVIACVAAALSLAPVVGTGTSGGGARFGRYRRAAPLALAALLLALAGSLAWPFYAGSFAQERLSRVATDLAVRQAHWADALAMRDPGLITDLLGMGIGRFPDTHYWRSSEARATSYRLLSEQGNRFLRLGTGTAMYTEQFVTIEPGLQYVVQLDLRSPQADGGVAVSLCEKWLLTSGRCVAATATAAQGGSEWQRHELRLASGEIGSGSWPTRRPVKLSLHNASASRVEIDNLRLLTPDGQQLATNGDFSSGLDRWFFTVDLDLPWHVWSMPVAIVFDLGWLGLTAFAALFALALTRTLRRALGGGPLAGAALAALTGVLVIATVDTVIDTPRFLLLLLLLTCIGWAPRKPRRQLRRSNRSPTRASSSDSAATSGGRVPPLGTSL